MIGLNIIRMLKMFAWEKYMLEELAQRRSDELKTMRKGRLLEIAMNGTNAILPIIAKLTTYSVYVHSPFELRRRAPTDFPVSQALVTKGDLSGELPKPTVTYGDLPDRVHEISVPYVLVLDGNYSLIQP